MKKQLLRIDVSSKKCKQSFRIIINFWLHDFLSKISCLDLDNDNIYKIAIWLSALKKRIITNKQRVYIRSYYSVLILAIVVNTFLACHTDSQTNAMNLDYLLREGYSKLDLGYIVYIILDFCNLSAKLPDSVPVTKAQDKSLLDLNQISSTVKNNFFDEPN